MNFQDQLVIDTAAILSTAVFGRVRILDGVQIICVTEELEYKNLGPAFLGGLGQACRLYIAAASLSGSYVPDQQVVLDGIYWTVAESPANANNGLQQLDLYRTGA